MDDKLLDNLIERLEPRRPRWGLLRGWLRINKIRTLRNLKWSGMSHLELELVLRLLDHDRTIERLNAEAKLKAKAKLKAEAKKAAKPKAKPKAKKEAKKEA